MRARFEVASQIQSNQRDVQTTIYNKPITYTFLNEHGIFQPGFEVLKNKTCTSLGCTLREGEPTHAQ